MKTLFFKCLYKIFPIYNKFFYYCHLNLTQSTRLKIPNIKSNYTVNIATEEDIKYLEDNPYSIQVYKDRPTLLDKNKGTIAVVKYKNNIIGFSQAYLIDSKHICETGYVVEPLKKAAWGYNFNIDRRYRSGKAFLTLTQGTNMILDKLNADYLITEIFDFNSKSLNSFGKLGQKVIKSYHCLALFKLRLFYTPKCKKVKVSII